MYKNKTKFKEIPI